MRVLEKKLIKNGKEPKHILLVSDDSERRFNIAKTSGDIDLLKADYFFSIMVSEKTARGEYNKY